LADLEQFLSANVAIFLAGRHALQEGESFQIFRNKEHVLKCLLIVCDCCGNQGRGEQRLEMLVTNKFVNLLQCFVQHFLLRKLGIIQSVVDVDQEEMGNLIGSHFTDGKTFHNNFPVFGLKDAKETASNGKAFL